jgi:muconolactone delta-isomerase
MKFLILQWVNPQVPVEKLAKLTPAQMKYVEEMRAKGRIEAYYHLIGQQGHMVIVKVDSDEELTRFVGDDPMFFHSHREVYPLTTLEAHRKHVMELLKK